MRNKIGKLFVRHDPRWARPCCFSFDSGWVRNGILTSMTLVLFSIINRFYLASLALLFYVTPLLLIGFCMRCLLFGFRVPSSTI